MSDTVILTFTYPQVEPYFEEFLMSCDRQTDKLFDVIIIDEGSSSIKKIVKKYPQLRIEIVSFKGSISENRLYGLKLAKQREYNIVILADSDDYFSENRVQKTKEILSNHLILANEVDLVNNKCQELVSHYFSKRLDNNSIIDFSFLRDKNVLGFSNSALRTELISGDCELPSDICVVDWFFFTLLLYKGHKAVFNNEIITYYRQYNNNMIGINNETTDNYKNKLVLKAKHYKELAYYISEFETLSQKYEIVNQLEDNQIEDLLHSNCTKYPFWWENINL